MAGEPAGLAAAYDRYAAPLYAYCRTLLSEPADAADSVQDTFIITVAKVGTLRERERFRPWLYAVARNECFRRLRARGLSEPLDEAGEMTPADTDPSAGPEREELRALVLAALSGLNPGDREVIELNLRHTLDGADLADALGVSRNQAHALASRARTHFEGSLGALLVARAGRDACADLDLMLQGWDGYLTILLRKRINRHIENCRVCGERRRRELSPAMLLSMLPMIALPSGLRSQILRLVFDSTPGMEGHRDLVVRRAGPWDRDGFPRPIEPPRRVYGVRSMALAGSAAAVAAILLGTGTVFALDTLHHKPAPAPAALQLGPGSNAPAPNGSGSHQASSPPSIGTTTHHSGGGGRPGSPGSTPGVSPTPSQPGSQPGGSGNPHPHPTPSPSQHTTSPPPPPPPSPGTLQVSGPVTLSSSGGAYSGSFTITAVGGQVSGYSIVDPAPAGDLSISPLSGGTLDAGSSVTVTISVASDVGLAFETDLTIDPGGLTVAVDYPPAG